MKGSGFLSLLTWFCEGLEENFAFLACLEEEDDLEMAGRFAAFPRADGLFGGESCRVRGAAAQAPGPVRGERAHHRRGPGHRPPPGQGVREARSQEGEHPPEGAGGSERPPAALLGSLRPGGCSPCPPPRGGGQPGSRSNGLRGGEGGRWV